MYNNSSVRDLLVASVSFNVKRSQSTKTGNFTRKDVLPAVGVVEKFPDNKDAGIFLCVLDPFVLWWKTSSRYDGRKEVVAVAFQLISFVTYLVNWLLCYID